MTDAVRETSVGSAASSTRYETFTEAVPLSLSSMAHASLPLEEGVLDGVKKVLSHTLLSCVNYARIVHPPHQWTFRDLTTSEFAWTPVKGEEPPRDLPYSLSKLQFQHQYTRNAWIYLKPTLPKNWTLEEELEKMKDWTHQVGILGRVSLLYASKEPLTVSELDGTDTEDMPATILYKVVVEYRSLPATGSQQAVQAEELSMSSFGGSVDDDVKYGALASLYDEHAKYVLEIYSVRGKKYKFDLMDSTLSDGTVPRLPSSSEGDPFVKSLCVTVTDHASSVPQEDHQKYAVTRMHLTLEGKPRHGLQDLPPLDYMTNGIKAHFLMLNPQPPAMATATPSNHTLLLDPASAGRVYVNGQYVTTWGQDPRIGSHGISLFGMDLLSIPFWRGRIVNYNDMKQAYAQLWYEILIDARLMEMSIANRLLHRLMSGHDPDTEEGNDYENDEGDSRRDTDMDCLETQVLSVIQYDRVGIAAKALGTRFGIEFGRSAYPCLQHETEWVKTILPDRKAIIVPQRLLSILRRGGYFNIQRVADELWFTDGRPAEGSEKDLVLAAIQKLERAGCQDVSPENILVLSADVADDVISSKAVCRYNELMQQYFVHEKLLSVAVSEFTGDNSMNGEEVDTCSIKAYLLGMYIGQAHPDGRVLPRYLLRNKPIG